MICVNGSHEELEHNRRRHAGSAVGSWCLLGRAGWGWTEPGTEVVRSATHPPRRNGWKSGPTTSPPRPPSDEAKPARCTRCNWRSTCNAAMGRMTTGWSLMGAIPISGPRSPVNMAGLARAEAGRDSCIPAITVCLGVGVSFALSAKALHPRPKLWCVISGDGAFLSGGLSIEAAFQENLPITVVVDNNGGLDCISQQQERLFASGKHFATDFRDIPFHMGCSKAWAGHGELVDDPRSS